MLELRQFELTSVEVKVLSNNDWIISNGIR